MNHQTREDEIYAISAIFGDSIKVSRHPLRVLATVRERFESMVVDIECSPEYPLHEKPMAYFPEHLNESVDKTVLKQLSTQLLTFIDEFSIGHPFLFEIIEKAQSLVDKVEAKPSETSEQEFHSDLKPLHIRNVFWFHHIYSKRKRKAILRNAELLGVRGVCFTGKPGILIVEGKESQVKEYSARIRGLNWQKMVLKRTETIETAKFSQFDEFDLGPSEIFEKLRKVGLEEYIREILGLE